MPVKNIVFDFGNVLVKWAPQEIIARVFPQGDQQQLLEMIFGSQVWYDLNLGKLTETAAIERYHQELRLPYPQLEALMCEVKNIQVPLEGSFELLKELHQRGIPLYAITDNIREIIAFLKEKYDFFDLFQGVVISAEVGALKPSKIIYRHLLDIYRLQPEETVFF